MDVRLITDIESLSDLAEAWNSLAERTRARPFQRFDWLATWERTLGTAAHVAPRVATLWHGKRLLAVLPLCMSRHKGLRLVEWLGARASDYCDALIDPAVEHDVLQRLWTVLLQERAFDIAGFSHVRADACVAPWLGTLKPWPETVETATGIDIEWPDGAAWLAGLGADARKSIGYALRRMRRLGFEFEVLERGERHDGVVDALMHMKRAWLERRGMHGYLLESAGTEFLRAAAGALAASGTLHLSAIRSRDAIAACHLGFLHEGVLHYYMPTYNPEWAKYGFGSLLRDLLIMWSADRGLRRFDMLLGAHDYGSRYTLTRETVRTLVVPRTAVGRACVSAYRLISGSGCSGTPTAAAPLGPADDRVSLGRGAADAWPGKR